MFTQEFVCQLLAGAMNVERLMHWHIGAADECLERPPTICSLDEFADELRDGDAALVSALGNNRRYVVWQMNDRRHKAQRTHRPREARTNFEAVREVMRDKSHFASWECRGGCRRAAGDVAVVRD